MLQLKKIKITTGIIALAIITAIALAAFKFTATKNLPASLLLPVPFTTQAPDGKWLGNENCEEASAVMANAYLTGDTENLLPAGRAIAEISALKKWEQANFGHSANTGSSQTAEMIRANYRLQTTEIKNYTESALKKALAENQVILLMIDASKLGNPTYQNSGRIYHVVVVRGYNQQGFILNDPGTEKGENIVYPFNILDQAAADWNQATKTLEPKQKLALAVGK